MYHRNALRLWLLLCVLAGFTASRAETLTVCDGTATNDYVPLNGLYQDTQGCETQFIYPASMLDDMVGGTISSITFYATASIDANIGTGTKSVTIGTTDGTTITTTRADMTARRATGTEVFNGGLPLDGAKMTITFSKPFTYDGGNLFIDFYVEVKGAYKGTKWYGVSTTDNVAGYANNASGSPSQQKFLPQAEFTYEAGEKVPYEAKVSTEALAFGTIGAGQTAQLSLTVRNRGTEAFTPTVSGLSAPFSTTYESAPLAAGATDTITVSYLPTEAGNHTGTMTISCGEAGTFTVALTGTAEQAIFLCGGTDTNETLPFYGYYYDTANSKSYFVYPAAMLEGYAGKQLTGVTFYANASFTLTGGAMSFYAGEVDATTATSTDGISDLTQMCSATPATGTDQITFSFDEPFIYNGGNLAFATNVDTGGSYAHIYFYGENQSYASGNSRGSSVNFLPKAKIAYLEPQNYAATVSTEALAYGSVVVGQNRTLNVTVTNTGMEAFTPALSGLEAPFTTTAEATELTTGGKLVIPVTFTPAEAGEATGTLTIDCGEAGTFAVALSGSGLAVPTGYQETFDSMTDENDLPDGWRAFYSANAWRNNHVINDMTETSQYFSIYDQDGVHGISSINSYAMFLVSPVLSGDVAIASKLLQAQSTPSLQAMVFPVADGKIMAASGNEYAITWSSDLSTDEVSYGFLHLDEPARVAIRVSQAMLDLVAADAMIPAADIKLLSLSDVPSQIVADAEGNVTVTLTATVGNVGNADAAAGDYTLQIYDNADAETVLATIDGEAVAAGDTIAQAVSFTYAPATLAATQQVTYRVMETTTGKVLTTSAVTVRALKPVAALYKAGTTTALTKGDLDVFAGERDYTVTLANRGTAPLTYAFSCADGVTAATSEGAVEPESSADLTLTVAATIDGTLATLATNDGDFTIEATAVQVPDGIFFEDFEDDLDAAWTVGASYDFADRASSTFNKADTTYNHRVAYISSLNYSDDDMISPAIEFDAETGLELHLTTFGVSFGSSVDVSYSTDMATWTKLEGVTTDRNVFTPCTVTMPEEGVYYLKFEAFGAAFDNIYGGRRAVLEHEATLAALDGPETGMVNYSATYTTTLMNRKFGDDTFTVTFLVDGEVAEERTVNAEALTSYELSFDYMPHATGTHTLQVTALAGEDYLLQTAVVNCEVAEESAISGVVVNPGTTLTTGNDNAVINGYYNNTGTRLLYTAEQLEAVGVKAGDKITSLAFLISQSTRSKDLDFHVWMRNSEATQLTAGHLCDDLDEEGFVNVYNNANILSELPANGGEFLMELSEPFVYDGGTLELLTATYGGWESKYPYFYYNAVEGQMLIVKRDDGTSYADYFASVNAIVANKLPSLKLYIENEPAVIDGTVTDAVSGEAIEGAEVVLANEAGVTYTATTGVDGAYALNVVQAGEGYTLTVTAEGYDDFSATVDATATATVDVAMVPVMPSLTLAEALTMTDGEAVALSDDLLVAAVEPDGTAILTDGNGNWIGTTLTEEQVETLAGATSLVGVKGVLGALNTNPTITLIADPAAGERTDEVVPEQMDMTHLMDVPGNSLATVAGYYADGKLRAFADVTYPGQTLAIDNRFVGDALEAYTNLNVRLTVIVRLNAPWDAPEGAPRRVSKDDLNSSSNYTIIPLAESIDSSVVTGIADINAGQAESVTYVNAAGQQSNRPFDGVNIVVTRHADGTVSTTKMVK